MILNLNEAPYILLSFNSNTISIDFSIDITPLSINSHQLELVLNELSIPQFLTDRQARNSLNSGQVYQLVRSNLVKVTPRRTNVITNLSRAFSYFRRVF